MQSNEKMIRDRHNELVQNSSLLKGDFPYPFFERSDDGTEHIEYDASGKFSLITTERGMETGREETTDFEEFMYMILEREAMGYGLGFAFKNLNSNENFRRVYFTKALEAMAEVSADWHTRLSRKIDEILATNPYSDDGK